MSKKLSSGGKLERVAWIPTKFANKGKYLELKIDGEWIDGWHVDSASEAHTAEQVEAMKYEYKDHRKITDK